MKVVISELVDKGPFFEIHEHYAENIIIGFSRIAGHSIGIVANPFDAVKRGFIDKVCLVIPPP